MFTGAPPAACTRRARLLAVALSTSFLTIACDRADVAAQRDVAVAAPPARHEAASPPRASVRDSPPHQAAPENPFATMKPDKQTIAGRIEERLAAGSYVYLAVRDRDDALRWAVVLGDAPAEGADVVLTSMGRHEGFRSPRLRREFSELHFAILADAPTS